MKKIQIAFVLVAALMVCLVLAGTNTKPDAVSYIDNRKLAEWNGNVDAWFKVRVGFRDEMINAYTVLNDRIFNEMVHPTYQYGEDGYVFFKMSEERYDTVFLDLFCRYLREVQDYCAERGCRFLYCLNPSKTTVYQEFLPDGYEYKERFHSLMVERLERYGVHYVDNVVYLQERAKEGQIFNRQYDAGHWNDLGAFYGTNHMLAEVAKTEQGVRLFGKDDFEIDSILEESLPVSKFEINERVPDFRLKDTSFKAITNDYQRVRLAPSTWFFSVWQTSRDSLPDVLFFHGSYYNSRYKFYQNRFHQVAGVHNYQNFLNFDYWFNLFHPDYVLLETAEYATNSGFFNMDVLRKKRLNHPYRCVRDSAHEECPLDSLPDFRLEPQSSLVELSFTVPDSTAFGYLLCAGREYDLAIRDRRASVVLPGKEFDSVDSKVALFPELEKRQGAGCLP